jgi:microcompartment protein CcmK/EutM
MVTPPPGLQRLMVAAELRRDRDLALVQRIDAEALALDAEARALRSAGAGAAELLAIRGEAARLVASWDELRALRLSAIGRRQAALAASREAARADLARSAGRVAAIRGMAAGKGRGQAS